MKKITLFVTALFVFGGAANASERIPVVIEHRLPVSIADAEPIVFTERGIEFFVFPDGQFDFNTRPATTGDYYYKSAGRSTVNRTHGAPGVNNNVNYGVRVDHDEFGRVRRVGNVFINYDANDRIKRIGSVYMSYNRYALSQVGGLQIVYNRHGDIVDFIGNVNGRRATAYAYNGNSNGGYNSYNPAPQNNNDFYYYKTDGTKAKVEEKR
ncbi:MAG TPA: hypothetical protein VF581_03950 [Flavobacterium sp.]|jgi:hypothetical protein